MAAGCCATTGIRPPAPTASADIKKTSFLIRDSSAGSMSFSTYDLTRRPRSKQRALRPFFLILGLRALLPLRPLREIVVTAPASQVHGWWYLHSSSQQGVLHAPRTYRRRVHPRARPSHSTRRSRLSLIHISEPT